MKKHTLMFVSSSDFDALKIKGVHGMMIERSEGGYFGKVISVHPLAQKSRTLKIDENHKLIEFGFDYFPGGSKFKILRYLYSVGYIVRAAAGIAQIIRRENVDVVRASDPYWAALVVWLALILGPKIPFIISIHADWDKRHELDPKNGAPKLFGLRLGAQMLAKFLLRKAHRVFCIRKSLFNPAISSGAQSRKLKLIPHGVELSDFTDKPINFLDKEFYGKKIIFFAGRLSSENYIYDILDLARIFIDIPDILFVLAGGGAEEDKIKAIINSDTAPLKNVYLLGSLSRKDVINLRKQAFINLALMGGYSLIEACASGRPTITYDVEWHSELIEDGETGWLIGEGDIKKISSAIKEMLKNPKLAKRIGERGKKAAFEAHNLEEVYKIRANLYDEAIKSYR